LGSQCTTRRYTYDPDSNRTQLDTNAALGAGFCTPTGSGQTVQHTYDDADRTTNSGYSYDPFGRTLTAPAADAGGSDHLQASYYVDDRAQTLTQSGVTQTFNLDPMERVRLQSTTGKPDQAFHYVDDSDNPAWISLGGSQSNWERFVSDPAGVLCATQIGHGPTSDGFTYQLTDLQGNVALTVNADGSAAGSFSTDEFGSPEGPAPADGHGWFGGKGRMTELASGVIAMGQRVYVPETGRFLQTDPVPGGSANDYDYADQDPVDQSDLTGTSTSTHWATDKHRCYVACTPHWHRVLGVSASHLHCGRCSRVDITRTCHDQTGPEIQAGADLTPHHICDYKATLYIPHLHAPHVKGAAVPVYKRNVSYSCDFHPDLGVGVPDPQLPGELSVQLGKPCSGYSSGRAKLYGYAPKGTPLSGVLND
jgi:RHS repeat-associated protein